MMMTNVDKLAGMKVEPVKGVSYYKRMLNVGI